VDHHFKLKNQNFILEINNKIGDFLQNFNNYFNENIFKEYTITIEKLMEEKYKKYLEISNNFDNQIKEMDLLGKDGNEEQKASINDIISNLKTELHSSLETNEETYRVLIKGIYEKFHQLGFKDNTGVKSIERTLEAEIYTMVHDMLASS